MRERLKGSRPDRKILEKFWCVEIGKVSRCNREVLGELKGAALFWRGKAAFFAGGEAVGGGGVTVPVEILGKMPKGRRESGRGIRGNAEFLKKRYFFIKGIPSGRDFGV